MNLNLYSTVHMLFDVSAQQYSSLQKIKTLFFPSEYVIFPKNTLYGHYIEFQYAIFSKLAAKQHHP